MRPRASSSAPALPLHVAGGLLLAAAAGALFATVAAHVAAGGALPAIDEPAQRLALAMATPALTEAMRAVSWFGLSSVVAGLSVALAASLLVAGSHRRQAAFLATMAGGLPLSGVLKGWIARARPSGVPVLGAAEGYSFPSGHALTATLFFGSLAYVLFFTLERHRAWRLPAAAACLLAASAVCWSRVYLGVHYLSDVLGGALAALCWLGLCLTAVEGWVWWRDRRRARGLAAAVLACVCAAPAASAQEARGPESSTALWVTTLAQAQRLEEGTARLEGLDLLLDSPAAPGAAGLLRGLRVAGARAGALVHEPELAAATDALDEADVVLVVGGAAGSGAAERAFRLKTLATRLRARRPGVRLGLEAAPEDLDELWRQGLAAYVDFAVAGGDALLEPDTGSPWPPRWRRSDGEGLSLPALLAAAARPAAGVVRRWPGRGEPADAPFQLRRLREALSDRWAPLRGLDARCGPEVGAGAACAAAAYLDAAGEAAVVVEPRGRVEAVVLSTTGPAPAPAEVLIQDLATGEARAAGFERAAGGLRVEVPAGAGAFLLRLRGEGGEGRRFAAAAEVVAAREPTLEEILARHQAAAARQRGLAPRRISTGRLAVVFQAPGLAAPVQVTAEVALYASPAGTDIEQRNVRLNGAPLSGEVPRLPIVEPERVAVAPLAIALDAAYRYRLEGRQRAGGRDCHVVGFSPAPGPGPSYRGRAWIDAGSFVLVRLHAVQTGLRGPVVSSEQTDEFLPVPHGGEVLWLPARTAVHQVYEGPGHRTPIERLLVLDRHEPEPPDFEPRLAAAHASDHVMLRETPAGLQYLRRERSAGGRRAPAGRATAVRTVAVGVLADPNIGQPLPFAGLGYADFDLLGTGTQLNAFLAGSFAHVSWSAPRLGRSAWRLQVAGFASLLEYNDRVFRAGRERYEETLRQRPSRLAVALSRPLAGPWRLEAGPEVSYTRLRRSGLTEPAFVVPPSPLDHGVRLALHAQSGPWTAALWWRGTRRQRWEGWSGSFQRFGASLARTAALSPGAAARVEASWMDGRGLDRFSRYAFDGFENPLTGYPVASVRYDRGLVLRSALTWRVRPAARVQVFGDAARVNVPEEGAAGRTLLGLGGGAEIALPWRLLLAAQWGYGLQGQDRDGRRGTHTFRLTAYRVF